LRRHPVCVHRGWWGGAVRWTGAGAVGGGGACAAIAPRGWRRCAGWCRVRFPMHHRAAPVGGGIAAAPKVHTDGTRHGKHAPCACMHPLRSPCVPLLCAHFGSSLCVSALRTPACPYCVHGVLVQFVVDMCVLEPMPVTRAHAVRARAVRPRALPFCLFYCILCSVPCLRLCLRKVSQVSLSAAEHPGHLIYHTFPPQFAPFVPALLSSCLAFFFAAKKRKRGGCVTVNSPSARPCPPITRRTCPLFCFIF